MVHRHWLALWCLYRLSLVSCQSSIECETLVDCGLVQWIRQNHHGGYFNPKQEIRHSSSSMVGVFAKVDIQKGELLTRIPWNLIITGDDEDGDYDYDDDKEEEEEETPLECATVRNLVHEMKLGNQSKVAPYIAYLKQQPRGQLPSDFSSQGKALLQQLLGGTPEAPDILPQDAMSWLEDDWYQICKGEQDPLSSKAAMLVVQRSDDDLMVPVYDMYNHRNGKYLNTAVTIIRGVRHELWASKDIMAGEQIHNSYNMCEECGGRKNGYGTASIFRDYGFVENYPRRWIFQEPELQVDFVEDETTGEITLEWHNYFQPSRYTVQVLSDFERYLQSQIMRLQQLENVWNLDSSTIVSSIPTQEELGLIQEYHEAVLDAYTTVYRNITGSGCELNNKDTMSW